MFNFKFFNKKKSDLRLPEIYDGILTGSSSGESPSTGCGLGFTGGHTISDINTKQTREAASRSFI